jgi:hypothetical protein
MTTITFTLTQDDADWLREHAWLTRRSVSQILRDQIAHLRKEADNPNARRIAEIAGLGE